MLYETERLILLTLGESDAARVLNYYIRNKDFLEEWEPLKSEVFYTAGFQREQLRKDSLAIANKSMLRLWIFKKDDPGRVIGSITFNNIVWGAFLSCHLGYKLDRKETNKGYITEAVKKGIEVIFDEYRLHRIEANIMPKNKASLRVVEKLGFYHEGLASKYLYINGNWEDHIHMVLRNPALE